MESLRDLALFDGRFAAAGLASPLWEDNGVCENPGAPSEISIPAYSSKPDAPATVYLDFKSGDEAGGGDDQPGEPCGNVKKPEFELLRGTSQEEFGKSNSIAVRVIKEIWQAVAEKFASKNVNVTTVHPGGFSDGKALRVAVGRLYQDCYRSMLQYR